MSEEGLAVENNSFLASLMSDPFSLLFFIADLLNFESLLKIRVSLYTYSKNVSGQKLDFS